MRNGFLVLFAIAFAVPMVQAEDLLVKLKANRTFSNQNWAQSVLKTGGKVENLGNSWVRVQSVGKSTQLFQSSDAVEYIQPNFRLRLIENYKVSDAKQRAALAKAYAKQSDVFFAKKDNPTIPSAPNQAQGTDPLFSKQWGMKDIGVSAAWNITIGSPDMIVAVIDTGVDYTHEDLLPNMWRNSREIPDNNIDDDGNGYVDDLVGWDFADNDNKPYDLAGSPIETIFTGANPGHGTHCAGNVAARGGNGIGIAGVAPNVKIMALRFLTLEGGGTTADAIKSIKYAVDNGAKVLSNSWGSEGEDSAEASENQALRDAIQYAQDKGVLFIAAAGNGHQGVGYDNDNDKAPGYPASYDHENIVSVAALDVNDKLGSFSNWGRNTVDIGAPGVNVYSTMVGNKYSDKVVDMVGITVGWDGTSMATPHVAGAAALYWSAHPKADWKEVKAALLTSAKKIPTLTGKTVSGGKLDVNALLAL
jgi:thermitase